VGWTIVTTGANPMTLEIVRGSMTAPKISASRLATLSGAPQTEWRAQQARR
jgi:hypothetical protein